ncbi:MAG: TonB-dependent receptor [Bacteroidota bacterium]|nr:TonB-dependent receptor [Bacteroidota bacterium]
MNYVNTVVVLLILSLLFLNQSWGQKSTMDTTVNLQTYTIKDNREIKFAAGGKTEQVDTLGLLIHKTVSLDELLSNQSRVSIKSYGAGGLATSSIRGAGAAHTAVLWNGFNLQSPTHGLVDLSLIPVNFMDEVSLQTGNVGTLWGSGAIGGVIHLKNKPVQNTGISASTTSVLGSFGEKQQQVNFSYKTGDKFNSTARLYYRSEVNDFSFTNTALADKPVQKQKNSELLQKGFLQENYIKLTSNQQLNIRFWYQQTDRNIPPVMTQTESVSNQKDNSFRVTSEWSNKGKTAAYFVRSAYFDETIEYIDKTYLIFSKSNVRSFISEAEANFILSARQVFNFGINNTYNEAVSQGYEFNPSQNRTALFSSYKLSNKKQNWIGILSARQEVVVNKFVPFIPAAGVEGTIIPNIKIKANVSRSYRIPSFNDLYWYPGGNPDLLPEAGWNQEAGVVLDKGGEKYSVVTELTVFNRNIKNWIIWLPEENYWAPQNIMQVWSRGSEINAKIKYKTRKVKYELSALTNYTVSTNEKAKNANDASVGKQLIYVPLYSGIGNFSISYKKWNFNYSHAYTGYRYTSSDNSQFLEPFHISGLYLKRRTLINKFRAEIFIRANNIFNNNYQVMAWRPMPGRHYQAGLTIQFN